MVVCVVCLVVCCCVVVVVVCCAVCFRFFLFRVDVCLRVFCVSGGS